MKRLIAAAAVFAACLMLAPAHARSINGSSDTPPPSLDPNSCSAGGLSGSGVISLGCIGPFRATAGSSPDAIFDEAATAWSLDKSLWTYFGTGSPGTALGAGHLSLPGEISHRQFMIEVYTTYNDGAGGSDPSLSIYWLSATSGLSVLDFATANGFGIDDALVFVARPSITDVPVPATMALVVAGLAGLLVRKRR